MSGVQLSLRLSGHDKVISGLNTLAARLPAATRHWLKRVLEAALKISPGYQGGTTYTTPPTGGGYVRTGILGRTTGVYTSGSTVTIKSNAVNKYGTPYSVYVLGNAAGGGQAAVHKGRWVTLREAVNMALEEMIEALEGEVEDSAEAVGL